MAASPPPPAPDGRVVALGVGLVGAALLAAWWLGRRGPTVTVGRPTLVAAPPSLGVGTAAAPNATTTVATGQTGAAALLQPAPLPDLAALAASPDPAAQAALATLEGTALRQLAALGYGADPAAGAGDAVNLGAVAGFAQAHGLAVGGAGDADLRAAAPAIDAAYRQAYVDAGAFLPSPAGAVAWWR